MGDLSVSFHLFSLIAFIVLAYLTLRLQADLKIWRDWNSSQQARKVTVNEPIRALRRFAAAIGAGFESDLSDKSLPPRRLRLHACFELNREAGIAKIIVSKGEKTRVDFVLVHEPSIMPVELNQLQDELGDGIEVAVSMARNP